MRLPLHAAIVVLVLLTTICQTSAADKPLSLHSDNPHYFLFRGKPAILLTSGEHYGSVLNREFDFVPYLNELQAGKFNLTRTFSGVYREVPGSFGIVDNTLAPVEPGRAYAVYVRGGTGATLDIALPAGTYRAEWINTQTGATDKKEQVEHSGGIKRPISPPYSEDIALRVRR